MDIDGLITFLSLLLHWRVVLSTAAGGLAGYALVRLAPWFTGLQGLLLACIGLAIGLFWQATAEGSRGGEALARASGNTSASTVVVAAALFGAIWGAVSSSSMHSTLAGAAMLFVVAFGWLRYVHARVLHLHGGHAWLSVAAAALAYPIAAVVAHNAA